MKKLSVCLLCVALLLCGCGKSREAERQAQFAEELQERRNLRFCAEVRAEYPDKTVRYRLEYEEDAECCTVKVLEPEEISGIRLTLRPDGTQLRFEDVTLDTGALDRYGLSPVSALPALTEALRTGHLESYWTEGSDTVWELVAGDTLTVQVWLDEELVPCHAELISEGRVNVFLDISDWNA